VDAKYKMRTYIVAALTLLSLIMIGFGGLQDIIRSGRITSEHSWNDGLYLLGLATLAAIVTK
jgi:hypothetical protein